MTACMFQSHNDSGLRAFYADIKVTNEDGTGNKASRSEIGATEGRFSATLSNPREIARKLYIFGKIAMACAGSEEGIRGVIENVRDTGHLWMNDERPMKRLELLVNDYNAAHEEKDRVFLLVASDKEDFVNVLAPLDAVTRDFPKLGRIRTVGTGSKFLLEQCEILEGQLSDDVQNPWNRAIVLLNLLRNKALGDDIFTNNRSSWGTFYEFAYLDSNTRTWVRGKSSMHGFGSMAVLDDRTATIIPHSRVVMYDPGESHGRLGMIGLDPSTGRTIFHDSILRNVTEPPGAASSSFWKTWRPKSGSILVHAGDSGNVSVSLSTKMLDGLAFEFGDTEVRFGVDHMLWDEIGPRACGNLSKNYTSYFSLSDDLREAAVNKVINPK